jgi:hypothetical protein
LKVRHLTNPGFLALLLVSTQTRAQTPSTDGCQLISIPDACHLVRESDIAALMSLNQAELTGERDSDPQRCSCSYELKSPLRTVGSARLTVYDLQTPQAARHRLHADHPFDKPDTLVQTDDATDEVMKFGANASEVAAVHGQYLAEFNVSQAEDAAKAHPTWAYRMERSALLAAGAAIVRPAGMPPDPRPLAREAPSPSVVRYASGQRSLLNRLGGYIGILPLALTVFLFVFIFRSVYLLRIRRKYILEHGLPGMALIESISDTGITTNSNPLVRYDVLIAPEVGPPYRATTRVVQDRIAPISRRVGMSVPVKIDPKRPKIFIFL